MVGPTRSDLSLTRAAEFCVKFAQGPRPHRQALAETMFEEIRPEWMAYSCNPYEDSLL